MLLTDIRLGWSNWHRESTMRDAAMHMSLVLLVAFTDRSVSYTSSRHLQHKPSTPAAVMMVERRVGDSENSDDDELISYEDWDLAWKRHALGSIIEAYEVIEVESDADETSCRDSAEAGRTAAIREFLQTLQICSFATLLVWSYTIATGGLLLLPTQGAGVALYHLRDVAGGDQLTQIGTY